MNRDEQIAAKVEAVYRWIEAEIERAAAHPRPCGQCGRCCDFEAFDHRLYVTSAELAHFTSRTRLAIPPSAGPRCPWNIDGRCDVHPYRFAGCRIFSCTGDPQVQARITEQALQQLKRTCEQSGLPYRYVNILRAGADPREAIR